MHDGDVPKLQSLGGTDEDERHPLLHVQAPRQHQPGAAAVEDAVSWAGSIR